MQPSGAVTLAMYMFALYGQACLSGRCCFIWKEVLSSSGVGIDCISTVSLGFLAAPGFG